MANAAQDVKHEHPDLRILLVEDSDIHRHLAFHVLQHMGYEADAVRNSRQAIKAYRQKPYHLVIMECNLPDSSQFMVARIIRLIEAQTNPSHRTPIIGLTTFAPKGFQEQCLRAGLDACYVKPFRDEMMQEIFRRWILPSANHSEAA